MATDIFERERLLNAPTRNFLAITALLSLAVVAGSLLPAGSAHVLYVAEPSSQDKQGDLRVRAVPVQLLGQDESEASSAVRAVSPDTAPLAAGMQVVVRGTALLKSMIPLQ